MMHRSFTRGSAFVAIAIVFTLLGALAPPVTAQGLAATVDLNTWLCPEGYDQHEDCEKIGGVSVEVAADGIVLGTITSEPEAPASIEVPVAAMVSLTVTGGQPDGATMESTALEFAAVEGSNPATLDFVEPAAVSIDIDGDGLTDDEEADLGTDPTNVDTDCDGVQDGGEINAGTDPLVADTDGDGFTDREELDLGSDPLDSGSFPQATASNAFEVQVFDCPEGHEGKATPDLCTEPAAGVAFTVYIAGSEFSVTKETDANGAVAFGDLGSGTFVLREHLDDLGFEITRYTAMCVGNNAPGVPEARQISYTDLGKGEYEFQLSQGEIITCSWYNFPAASDETPVPVKTPPATEVPITALPSTGSGDAENDVTGSAAPLLASALALAALAMGIVAKRRYAR